MPKQLILDNEVERFQLDEEWYDIKRKMSYGEQMALTNELLKLASIMVNNKQEIPANAPSPTLMLINIKAWSLKDEAGNSLPVTVENINRLDPSVALTLIDEINRRNPKPKALGDEFKQ